MGGCPSGSNSILKLEALSTMLSTRSICDLEWGRGPSAVPITIRRGRVRKLEALSTVLDPRI